MVNIFESPGHSNGSPEQKRRLPNAADIALQRARREVLALDPQVKELHRRMLERHVVPTSTVVTRENKQKPWWKDGVRPDELVRDTPFGRGWRIFHFPTNDGGVHEEHLKPHPSDSLTQGVSIVMMESGLLVETYDSNITGKKVECITDRYDMSRGDLPRFLTKNQGLGNPGSLWVDIGKEFAKPGEISDIYDAESGTRAGRAIAFVRVFERQLSEAVTQHHL